MEVAVADLLSEFPRVKRAALAGETVIIRAREGTLRLTLDQSAAGGLVACLQGQLMRTDDPKTVVES